MKNHPPEQTNFAKEPHRQPLPYWKRAHRDWKIWVAVVMVLLATIIYIATQNLSMRPHNQMEQRVP